MDGRNPAPPGMYKTLWILGNQLHQLVQYLSKSKFVPPAIWTAALLKAILDLRIAWVICFPKPTILRGLVQFSTNQKVACNSLWPFLESEVTLWKVVRDLTLTRGWQGHLESPGNRFPYSSSIDRSHPKFHVINCHPAGGMRGTGQVHLQLPWFYTCSNWQLVFASKENSWRHLQTTPFCSQSLPS